MGCTSSVAKKPKSKSGDTDTTLKTKSYLETKSTRQLEVPVTFEGEHFPISHADFVKARTRFKEEYHIKEQLGAGAFGEVRKVVHRKTALHRAVKIVVKANISDEAQDKLIEEVQILKTLDHANIMKIFELYSDKSKYYIVSELLEGGELFERIIQNDRFSERDAAKIMKQLLSAIAYCHKHNIVHRDLKPENLVYDSKDADAKLKVIDFGTAKIFTPDKKMNETYGTAYYIAPEVISLDYTEKCDIWSCGVIMFVLLGGTPPFNGRNDREILEKVKTGKYTFDDALWKNVSKEAKKLIKSMMEFNPAKRCSAQEALEDEWFKKVLEKENIDQPLARENLNRLKNFRFESKLQEATWVFLVSYFSTKKEQEKLFETFKALDTDNDGQLTKEELKQGYIRILNFPSELAEREAEKVMRNLDKNMNGNIDYSEFINATISKQNLLTKEKLEAAFKMFDRNGDGKITAEEMRSLFNERKAETIPDKVWNDWIKQVDLNADGGISLDEFKTLMLKLL